MKIKMKVFLTLFVLSMFIIPYQKVSAAVDAAEPNQAKSKASVTFTPGKGVPEILDPSNPDQHNPEVEESNKTGFAGPLTLDYVSSINFGQHTIEADKQVLQSTTDKPFIQVTDRRGTGEGWNVTATASSFYNEKKEVSLPGAVIRLNQGEAVSSSGSRPPQATEEVVLHTSDSATAHVVVADQNEGLGSWITRWFPSEQSQLNDNVTLEIPAGSATVGNHTAVITWTLDNTP